MNISVACAIGPSVNTLKAKLIFSFQNPIFAIYLNFKQQNPLKNQSLAHLGSNNCEISSIKPNSPHGSPTMPRKLANSNEVFSSNCM